MPVPDFQSLMLPPTRIDLSFLRHYPAYVAWRKAPSQTQDSAPTRSDDAVETPEEALDHAAAQLRQSLEADLLDRVRAAPSAFLERVVVDLLIAMGYGGGDTARGRVTGQAGDGLTALSGSSDTSVAEVRQRVAAAEGLTPEEVQELLPSGRQPVFTNRRPPARP